MVEVRLLPPMNRSTACEKPFVVAAADARHRHAAHHRAQHGRWRARDVVVPYGESPSTNEACERRLAELEVHQSEHVDLALDPTSKSSAQ